MPFLLALLACSSLPLDSGVTLPWSDDIVPPDEATRPPPELTLTVPPTLLPGATERIEVRGAAPDETVYLASSTGVGDGPCHAGLGGRCLGISAPVVQLQTSAADADGLAVFDVFVPERLESGFEIATQAILVRGFSGSDTVMSEAALMVVAEVDSGVLDTGPAECQYDTGVGAAEPVVGADRMWSLTREFDQPVTEAAFAYDHHHAKVDVQADGTFLVAWDEGDWPYARVKASLFESDGSFRLNDFYVGFLGWYAPGRPDIAPRSDGGWLLTYGAGGAVGYAGSTEIWLAHFDERGLEVNRAGPVNEATGTAEFQGMPDIALDGDGSSFTLMFMYADEDRIPRGRYYTRRFDEDLTPISEERLVAVSPLDASPPDAAGVGDGVAVSWSERRPDCEADEMASILVQRLDGGGFDIGEPLRVDQSGLSLPPSRPAIAGTPTGRFAMAWRGQDELREGVGARLRIFDPVGRPLGPATVLEAERSEEANRPVLEMTGDILVAAWEESFFLHDRDVFMQAFDVTTGEAITEPVRVNFERTFSQERPDVAIRDRGDGTYEVFVTYERMDEPAPAMRYVHVSRWLLSP